jgi:hypothetical protein
MLGTMHVPTSFLFIRPRLGTGDVTVVAVLAR